MTTPTRNPGSQLTAVLGQLADLLAQVPSGRYGAPTPCSDYTVAHLRNHILGWANFFAVAFEDHGHGDRPDGASYAAPFDPDEAAAVLRSITERVRVCVGDGVADREVMVNGTPRPGDVALTMCLCEYLVHGHDLASAVGLTWNPPADAVSTALPFLATMLTDDMRGPGLGFGPAVEVPADAPDLDRLVAFTGRDPNWAPR